MKTLHEMKDICLLMINLLICATKSARFEKYTPCIFKNNACVFSNVVVISGKYKRDNLFLKIHPLYFENTHIFKINPCIFQNTSLYFEGISKHIYIFKGFQNAHLYFQNTPLPFKIDGCILRNVHF